MPNAVVALILTGFGFWLTMVAGYTVNKGGEAVRIGQDYVCGHANIGISNTRFYAWPPGY